MQHRKQKKSHLREVKTASWTPNTTMWIPLNVAALILGWALQKSLTPNAKLWRRNQKTSTVKNVIGNSRSVPDLSLSFFMTFCFFSSSSRGQLSLQTLFLSLSPTFIKSLLANQHGFLCVRYFSHNKLITRSNWHWRYSATRINPFDKSIYV